MELDLSGKTALVTGASGDIGAACATALARCGASVRVTGRSAERLDALVAAIRASGGAAEATPGDLADDAFLDAVRALPAPDLLIHAAGHRFSYARFHAQQADDAALSFRVDVSAFDALAAWALPEMMGKRFGRIVAVTSLVAHAGANGSTRYGAAKAALEGMVRGFAVEYGRFGITANAVAPGFIATTRLGARADEEGRARLAALTSLKRVGHPDDVAGPVLFLCSSLAAYVTGTTLVVAGGANLNNQW